MAMIETINLTKKYGELVALDNLNLSVEEGACLGFIGPNGAGKTTTIKILGTLLKPTWGEARIDGKVVGLPEPPHPPGDRLRSRTSWAHTKTWWSWSTLSSSPRVTGSMENNATRLCGDVLDLTDLGYKSNSEVNSLSRGMQQRLSIARVLAARPEGAADGRAGLRP